MHCRSAEPKVKRICVLIDLILGFLVRKKSKHLHQVWMNMSSFNLLSVFCITLSEKIAHPTVYHHLSQLSVNIQLNGLIKCKEDSIYGHYPLIFLENLEYLENYFSISWKPWKPQISTLKTLKTLKTSNQYLENLKHLKSVPWKPWKHQIKGAAITLS